MTNLVEVLFNGYSYIVLPDDGVSTDSEVSLSVARANCSCVLITGNSNVIVDTRTPWDKDSILKALGSRGITPDEINFVVSTHGHSDHIGNNNLFLNAKHIVGYCLSFRDQYYLHPFDQGQQYSSTAYIFNKN